MNLIGLRFHINRPGQTSDGYAGTVLGVSEDGQTIGAYMSDGIETELPVRDVIFVEVHKVPDPDRWVYITNTAAIATTFGFLAGFLVRGTL